VTKAEVFDLEERDRVVVASLDSEQSSVSVRVGDETVVLPENANRAVRWLLRDLATGVPVHVIPADAELTTQQAADLLGLSRTYVVRLIDQGSLPAHMAGTHRRLLASDPAPQPKGWQPGPLPTALGVSNAEYASARDESQARQPS
jgi:excisionase family DNA binding protein